MGDERQMGDLVLLDAEVAPVMAAAQGGAQRHSGA
jgi:hypothetical protein